MTLTTLGTPQVNPLPNSHQYPAPLGAGILGKQPALELWADDSWRWRGRRSAEDAKQAAADASSKLLPSQPQAGPWFSRCQGSAPSLDDDANISPCQEWTPTDTPECWEWADDAEASERGCERMPSPSLLGDARVDRRRDLWRRRVLAIRGRACALEAGIAAAAAFGSREAVKSARFLISTKVREKHLLSRCPRIAPDGTARPHPHGARPDAPEAPQNATIPPSYGRSRPGGRSNFHRGIPPRFEDLVPRPSALHRPVTLGPFSWYRGYPETRRTLTKIRRQGNQIVHRGELR
jgi:hypothetical protein